MKKASKILLTISGVVYLIAAIALAILGIVWGIMAFVAVSSLPFGAILTEYLQEFVENISVPEDMIDTVVGIVAGIVCLVTGAAGFVMCLIVSIINFKGAKAKKKGILIANIVFGVLCESILGIAGGVLGIIGLGQEERRAAQPAQEEVAPAPAPAPAPAIEEKKEEPAKAEPVQEEPKQEAPKAREDWFCPNCGAHNTGKFCQSCGTKRPE